MKFLARASLAIAIAVALTPALAADLPTHKDMAAAPTPVSPWGGFYLGGFAGGSFASAGQALSLESSYIATTFPTIIPQIDGDGSQQLRGSGVDLGVEAGYNWNLGQSFVVGVAGDFNWSGLKGARTTDGFLLPAYAPLLPYTLTQQLSNDWRGSLRLRAGVTPLDNLLLYATGGPALGQFAYKSSFWDRLDPPFYTPANETENATLRAIRAGWTLGGGAEWAISRNWSLAGEYLHSEFASFGGTDAMQLVQPASTAYVGHSTGAIRLDSVRVGLNYHFD
jgi:outer membrane immunogenic protein